ncbi:glycosyltransferase family 4 protein [Caldinitratiruptor microaerophilus]|uniref:Undecaprenyl-phosphate alpha-N-acetylglucosaminyl 1-phosphate transferase n=1 Tax=Caldinitratiruptor microaerophilus TaxID=671077 RepID=A0AA35CMM5_9FIRM|nr:MraY family glycosyltransferase [Caldinitratiruptor microaerophilus]BDG60372.1 undecaprenyl-phosphate alpha-N-acetylglucosaminyl 1-phosphate transferase [Caldinitratiruptor microaerophilus]
MTGSLALSFGMVIVVAAGLTWVSMGLARRFNIVDMPGEIKIHLSPTPRFGGIGIIGGTLFGVTVLGLTGSTLSPQVWVVIVGGVLAAGVGVLDDLWSLKPLIKLEGQLIPAVLLAAFVIRQQGPIYDWAVVPLTVLALGVSGFAAFVTNAFNLLDGMDGLAGGVGVLCAVCLGIMALRIGDLPMAKLLFVVAASTTGFLPLNLPRARTFMGDTGSLFLGYVLGASGVAVAVVATPSISRAVALILILVVPLSDGFAAVWRRLRRGQSVMAGDRDHLYDRLLARLGANTWVVLLVMWGLTATSGVLGLSVMTTEGLVSVSTASVATIGLALLMRRVGTL